MSRPLEAVVPGAHAATAGTHDVVWWAPRALALVAMCVQLFSLTDFRHDLLSPLLIFVEEVLTQRHTPTEGVHLRRTLFLSSCAMHLIGASGRWLPELHTTAKRLLQALMANPPHAAAGASPRALRFSDLHKNADDAAAIIQLDFDAKSGRRTLRSDAVSWSATGRPRLKNSEWAGFGDRAAVAFASRRTAWFVRVAAAWRTTHDDVSRSVSL